MCDTGWASKRVVEDATAALLRAASAAGVRRLRTTDVRAWIQAHAAVDDNDDDDDDASTPRNTTHGVDAAWGRVLVQARAQDDGQGGGATVARECGRPVLRVDSYFPDEPSNGHKGDLSLIHI